MKKLKFIMGGQPFRSTDFELLQNDTLEAVRHIFSGVVSQPAIVSGLDFDFTEEYVPGTFINVPEGYIYDLTEICHVPTQSFSFDSDKSIYLRLSNTDSSFRTLAGGTNVAVMTERLYNIVYTDTPESGDILLSGMERIAVLSKASYTLQRADTPYALESGFAPLTGTGLYSFANDYSDCMIACKFSASAANGVVAVLKEKYRPKIDTVGWFRAGNTIQALSIRTNGNVEVHGAVTSGTNVIMFKYNNGIDLT